MPACGARLSNSPASSRPFKVEARHDFSDAKSRQEYPDVRESDGE
jgi:hypothetical protein